MLLLPALAPEDCLILHQTGTQRPTYQLIHKRAEQSIWASTRKEDGGQRSIVKVRQLEAPITRDLAMRVTALWEKMLRGVRYPDPKGVVHTYDGETIEFRRFDMYGETWNPAEGAPKLFVDLGRSLIKYCDSAEAQRPGRLKVVEEKCRRLEEYLDKKAGD